MPNYAMPSGQDWDSVNVGRSSSTARAKVPKSAKEVTLMKAQGKLVTERKYGAASNSSAHSAANINARKLEESDELKHAKVDRSLSKAIQQARMAKKMTQKDLATAINEKPQVVGEYESGKAIPNGQIISKLERSLGCKLPRPGKKPGGGGAKAGAGRGGAGGRGGGVKHSGLTRGGPPKRR